MRECITESYLCIWHSRRGLTVSYSCRGWAAPWVYAKGHQTSTEVLVWRIEKWESFLWYFMEKSSLTIVRTGVVAKYLRWSHHWYRMKEYDLLRSSVNARTPFSFPGHSVKLRNPGFFSLVQLRDDFSSILQRPLFFWGSPFQKLGANRDSESYSR